MKRLGAKIIQSNLRENSSSILVRYLEILRRYALVMVLLFVPCGLYPQTGGYQDTTDLDEFLYEDDEYGYDEYEDFGDEGYFEDEGFEDEGYYEDEGFADEEYYEEGEFEGEEFFGDDEFFDEGEFADDEEFYDEEGYFDEEELLEGDLGEDTLELADDQAGEVEIAEVEQKPIRPPRELRGYTAKVSVTSPWAVGLGLNAWWYSFLDGRLTLDVPGRVRDGIVGMYYQLELASYGFSNQHPSGGQFSGLALLGLIRVPRGSFSFLAGGGVYGFKTITGGAVFGLAYHLPFFKYIDITTESRLNYTMKGTPTGASYWIDIGASLGFKF